MDVTAIVVNWNTADLLDRCLSSLVQHGPVGRSMEIVVVDNGSSDGSADLVRRGWGSVRLIANPMNAGYQRANNQAIEVSRGHQLLLINADAQLEPGCLDLLLARMDRDPTAAVVAPRLVYGDGSFQRWTAGRAPDLASATAYFLCLDRLPSRRVADRSLFLARDRTEAFQPDWVSSACMLVRRAALDEVGLLDERYLCYMDDVDICQRVRDAGWSVWYEPEALAIHLMGQSSQRQTGAASPAALVNFNDYFRRRHGRARAAVLAALQIAGFAARAAAYALLGVSRSRPAARRQARAHVRNLRVSLSRSPVTTSNIPTTSTAIAREAPS